MIAVKISFLVSILVRVIGMHLSLALMCGRLKMEDARITLVATILNEVTYTTTRLSLKGLILETLVVMQIKFVEIVRLDR